MKRPWKSPGSNQLHQIALPIGNTALYRLSQIPVYKNRWFIPQSDRCSFECPWSTSSVVSRACRLESLHLKFTNEPSLFGDGDLAESIKRSVCFRSAKRFGAVGSSPDFSRVFSRHLTSRQLNLSGSSQMLALPSIRAKKVLLSKKERSSDAEGLCLRQVDVHFKKKRCQTDAQASYAISFWTLSKS